MSRRSVTKDERFLLELSYLLEETQSDTTFLSDMEKRLHLSHSTAKNIASLLAQTGFIRYSHREGLLVITEKGKTLCKELDT